MNDVEEIFDLLDELEHAAMKDDSYYETKAIEERMSIILRIYFEKHHERGVEFAARFSRASDYLRFNANK